jgi:starch synthase
LADTVQEYDPRTGEGIGFVFENYDPWEFFAAVVRALALYPVKDIWRQLQLHGMAADHSWHASAARYVDIYRNAIEYHNSGQ